MNDYELRLLRAWSHGAITDTEFALGWQLYQCSRGRCQHGLPFEDYCVRCGA